MLYNAVHRFLLNVFNYCNLPKVNCEILVMHVIYFIVVDINVVYD